MLKLSINTEQNKKSYFVYVLLGIVVSCYFFPFEFTFLPSGINTKIMLAVLGIFFLGHLCIDRRKIEIDSILLYGSIFAIIFSAIGYISMDINYSSDSSYATYFISFATWLGAAYATYRILKSFHGYVDFTLLVNYLTAVCVVQCGLALAIDMIPTLKTWVDTYISQDTVANVEFLNEVKRLYGIGAAVDVAGTRFSIVLLCLAAVLVDAGKIKSNWLISIYWMSFIIIIVIGNMISRTTIVGALLGFLYLAIYSGIFKTYIQSTTIRIWALFFLVSTTLIAITIFFYQTNASIQTLLKFGFEGFFNWYETGTWTTESTERLGSVMWIWPEPTDLKTWTIGMAIFDDWHAIGTDIGYCRFIFYNGLVGLSVFTLFFVYNAVACWKKFPRYGLFSLLLLSLTFIIWMKVATDLFIIYALFYCIDEEGELNV